MILTNNYAALCAAIDAGDDTALPALADWLEEQGNQPLADGLRLIRNERPAATGTDAVEAWFWSPGGDCGVGGYLPDRTYVRLLGGEVSRHDLSRSYPSRSAAYLALAEALGANQ